MNAKQLQEFKRRLELRRSELTRVLTSKPLNADDLDHGRDEGDRANTALNKDMLLRLSAQDRNLFEQVDSALSRLASGGFGSCQNCTQEIPIKRLEALPWTLYCLTCQELIEEQTS